VHGTIKSMTDFASSSGWTAASMAWCTVGPGLEPAGRSRGAQLQQGQEVDASVLAIDGARERISLGIKQLSHDPLTQFMPSIRRARW